MRAGQRDSFRTISSKPSLSGAPGRWLWLAPALSGMGQMPRELDELGAARLAEGRQILASLVGEYDGLETAAQAERWGTSLGQVPGAQALHAWKIGIQDRPPILSAEQRRCLLFALSERLSAGGEQYSEVARQFYWLTREAFDLVAGDVRLLAVVAELGPKSHGYEPFEFVVDMVKGMLQQRAAGVEALVDAVADQVLGWNAIVYRQSEADYVFKAALDPEDDPRCYVAELRDKAQELAGRAPAYSQATRSARSAALQDNARYPASLDFDK